MKPTDFAPVNAAIKKHFATFQKPGVLSVRPGYKFKNDWITDRVAIVVTVERKIAAQVLASQGQLLPPTVGGFPVDVCQASATRKTLLKDPSQFPLMDRTLPPEQMPPEPPDEILASGVPLTRALSAPKAQAQGTGKTKRPYAGPKEVALTPRQGTFTLTAAVSPDAGWAVLEPFLLGVNSRLTVGLYDFTSAHILATVKKALAGKKLALVLDRPNQINPSADQSNEATHAALHAAIGNGLDFAWAASDDDRHSSLDIFPSAYHIKVAVRDGTSVWISSGNWNNSNQPNLNPAQPGGDRPKDRDRDWHVVIDDPDIAGEFEAYLRNDLAVAKPNSLPDGALPKVKVIAPGPKPPINGAHASQLFSKQAMTITPLLTPDKGVYIDAVTKLVKRAQRNLCLQYQYIQPSSTADPKFMALIRAVIDRAAHSVDVKVLVSEFQTREHLEELRFLGLDVFDLVRVQTGVHNKGIVVDTNEVLISSQNWSSEGTMQNRDAGVIIANPAVAQYYEDIFMEDWNTRGKSKVAC